MKKINDKIRSASDKGFTLVELMIVIAISSIVLTVVILAVCYPPVPARVIAVQDVVDYLIRHISPPPVF